MQWTYVVRNTGLVPLSNVSVSDDKGIDVSCPKTDLQVSEPMTCTGGGTVTEGDYTNVGTVKGTASCGGEPSDTDPVHYNGVN